MTLEELNEWEDTFYKVMEMGNYELAEWVSSNVPELIREIRLLNVYLQKELYEHNSNSN